MFEALLELALVERRAGQQLLGLGGHLRGGVDEWLQQAVGALVLAAELGDRRQPVDGERSLRARPKLVAQRHRALVVLGHVRSEPSSGRDECRPDSHADPQLGRVPTWTTRQQGEVIQGGEQRVGGGVKRAPGRRLLADLSEVLGRARVVRRLDEVLGQLGHHRVRPALVAAFERLSDRCVGDRSPIDRDPVVEHLAIEVVGEGEPRRQRAVRPPHPAQCVDLVQAPGRRRQRRVDVGERLAERGRDGGRVELGPGHRGGLQGRDGRWLEPGELLLDELPDGLRHLRVELVDGSDRQNAAVVHCDASGTLPAAQDLLHEQRHTTAPTAHHGQEIR